MDSISGDELEVSDGQESGVQEEKIFVAVRLRPLNEKEIAKGDASDWECINSTTIVFKNNLSERSMYPNAYSFDRVYGCDSSTKEVYDEGVKGIALSVLNGINSSIFAYGQTSSGKTYTMSGITEYAITDIYDYITKHNDREFVLKFSAIEIYNECVRDLLGQDGTPLRLLDDPEKGTVVEKLTEAHLRDCIHLKELIYVCEAERQIGETALNETSSRSHQILRLAVESSPHEFRGDYSGRTLAATVNFVDLAGSERASQTLAAGARLKEGCHINRSLLTLGTVIRKLSKGGNGHIPYRNSKLTRILQNSLGGNAKTAILCTICPAHSHLEQSRNTLLFASCAKHVNTNAQVNVVMSDKALVKQLQQELARLENELRMSPSSNVSISTIKDMKLQIQKMGKEIEDLTQQRDLSQSRLEQLIRVTGIDQSSLPWADPGDLSEKGSRDGYLASDTSKMVDPHRFDASLNTNHLTNMEGTKTLDENQHFLDENSPTPSRGSQKISQETRRNTKDIFNEDQYIDNMSSIDNNIEIDQEDSSKKDQNIEKTSSKDNNINIDQEDSSKKDQSIEKTSSKDNNIKIDQEDSSKKDQHIENTSRKDNIIEMNTKQSYNEGQEIETTSRKDNSIIMSTEESFKEDQHIMKTSRVDDDITMNPEGKEDQSIQETTNTHINTIINPESKEDRHIKKTSSIDENFTINPEENYKEDQNVQETSSIDENATVNPEENYKEDQHIEETSNKDSNIKRNLEDIFKEEQRIEKTSSIGNKIVSEEAHLDDSYGSRKKKTVDIQTNVDHAKSQHAESSPCSSDTDTLSDSENIFMARSKSCSVFTMNAASSPPSEKEIMIKSTIVSGSDGDFSGKQEGNKQILTKSKSQPEFATKTRQLPPTSVTGVDEKEMEQNMKLLVEDDVYDHFSTPKTPNELLPFNSQDVSIEEMVNESEAKTKELGQVNNYSVAPDKNWSIIFEKQRREIIRLWDACNTPLIHRTYFFLLFKGDQSDSVYLEVELRRLSFLVNTPSSVTSARALSRERLMLSKKLLKTFSAMQRDGLFQKWGIPLNSKHRRVQLSRLVWTKMNDMDHIKDSAELVAKLVGIVELNQTPKELFGLSFLPNPDYYKTSFWKASMSFI